jgi:hypothetical protein
VRRVPRSSAALALAGVAAVAGGCGSGPRQDADEPSGTFSVQVVSAKFPAKQHLARQEQLVIEVRNADHRTIPDVAVTVPSFTFRDDRQDLADPNRPIWIVDSGPRGGITAYTNTWALGPLRPGHVARFVWRLTPVRAGAQLVRFRVAAGLSGKAKAQTPSGDVPEGTLPVRISGKPAIATVDPRTGKVVRGKD